MQRDNDTLMIHMSGIMEKGSYVDHRNDYKHWSLNYGKRVNEMQRIQKENIKMLGRIQSRPANYKVSEWLKDRDEKERLIGMITAHPTSHQTRSALPSAVKERRVYSHPCLAPLEIENGSLTTLDPSVTDTIESLERELEAAKLDVEKFLIPKSDFSELKSMKKPPVLVILVLEAYAIVFNLKGDNLWRLALSLDHSYLERIDLDSIPLSVLKKLQFYIENPKINEQALKCVSFSIVSVWKWVERVYHYGTVAHKYRILAEEKGIKKPVAEEPAKPAVEYSPAVVKEKEETHFPSLELSKTDTIESLQEDLGIARKKVSNCMIKPQDFTELKSMSNPPAMVKLVMDAYVILFNQKGDNLWHLAKKCLAQSSALPNSIDLDNIPISVLRKLKIYIEDKNITYSQLRKVCSSIVPVWKWVESVYHYGTVAHKYRILAEEKGIKKPVEEEPLKPTVEYSSVVVKEKKETHFPSLELSKTDTIESLEKELGIAKKEVSNLMVNKNEVSEVKSLSNPPTMIKLVMEAYAILHNQKGDNLWHLGVKRLAQHNAASLSIDLDNIPISVLRKLKIYIEEQNITHSHLKKVSMCILTVWKWVESVYHYGVVAYKLDQLSSNSFSKDTS